MLIDTHCHLDAAAFEADREAVWSRARAAGVAAVVIPGVEPASWSATCALARAGERFVALGIHPQALPFLDDAAVDRALAELPERARACGAVAIGECGLDGGIDLVRAPFSRQRRVLAAHAAVARALDLPLIVHVLRAHGEALAALPELDLAAGRAGVVHSYSGSAEVLDAWLARGFYVGFAGAVTRPTARRPVAAARAVPRDRLLIETDGPDQPPTGAFPSGPEGRRCEPAHVALTLARLAEIRGEDPAELERATTANALALFRLVLSHDDAPAVGA